MDGRCTIKIVEMADKSLYALKLEIIRISFLNKFSAKNETYEMSNGITRPARK